MLTLENGNLLGINKGHGKESVDSVGDYKDASWLVWLMQG